MATIKEFAFDCTLICAIRVKAASEAEARATMRDVINATEANLGAWPSGDPILCEVSLDDQADLTLYEVDGEEVNHVPQ